MLLNYSSAASRFSAISAAKIIYSELEEDLKKRINKQEMNGEPFE
jgi:hypothetical protein